MSVSSHTKKGTTWYIESQNGDYLLEIGATYILKPHNSMKKRNCDRICVLRGFIEQFPELPIVRVKFLDNNHAGR